MYLLTRKIKGFGYVHNLGVFDTEEDARKYQKRCEPLHRSIKYTYEITPIKYFKTEEN